MEAARRGTYHCSTVEREETDAKFPQLHVIDRHIVADELMRDWCITERDQRDTVVDLFYLADLFIIIS